MNLVIINKHSKYFKVKNLLQRGFEQQFHLNQ
jgi:hypothetical protein